MSRNADSTANRFNEADKVESYATNANHYSGLLESNKQNSFNFRMMQNLLFFFNGCFATLFFKMNKTVRPSTDESHQERAKEECLLAASEAESRATDPEDRSRKQPD